jgi:hypothetical protein
MKLGREDLRLETIAILAEVIAADARFNMAVAKPKRGGQERKIYELLDLYEPIVDLCTMSMDVFDLEEDEGKLVRALESARDILRERTRALDGDRTAR